MKKELQQQNFFAFSMIAFFSMLWHFSLLDIAKSAVSLSVQGLFFNICKWSKNACPTFLEKKNLYLKGLNVS